MKGPDFVDDGIMAKWINERFITSSFLITKV